MAGPSVPRCEPRPVAAASHARTAGVDGRHRRNPVQRAGPWRNAASAHGRSYDDKPRLHPFLPRHARRAAAGGDRAWPPTHRHDADAPAANALLLLALADESLFLTLGDRKSTR